MTTESWQTWLDENSEHGDDSAAPRSLEEAFARRLMEQPIDPPAATVPAAAAARPTSPPILDSPPVPLPAPAAVQTAPPAQVRPRETGPIDLPSILKHMARRLAVARSAREGFQVVYGAARRAVQADLFMIATFAPSGDAMRVEFLIEEGKVEPPTTRSPLPPFYRRLLHATSPVLLPTRDVILHEHSASLWQVGDPSPFAHTALFVPLREDQRVFGFISVQSYEPHAFSVREIEWLSRIAREAVAFIRQFGVAAFEAPAAGTAEAGDETWSQDDDRESRLKQEAATSVLEHLLAVLDRKDHFTRSHATRVRQLAVSTAEALQLTSEQRYTVERAALLLDIGKIGLPDTVLHKNGTLTQAEMSLVRQHTVLGETIAREAATRDVLAAIRSHHERWDGTGYPDGLAGHDIPWAARLLSVIDSYVAMTSERPHRRALTPREAATQLRAGAGTRYDPEMVEAFLRTQRDPVVRQGGPRHWTATFLDGKGVASL